MNAWIRNSAMCMTVVLAVLFSHPSVAQTVRGGWSLGPKAREAIGSGNMFYAKEYLSLPDYILMLEKDLDLTDSQKKALIEERLEQTRYENNFRAMHNVYRRELLDMLEEDVVDMDKVEKKVREMEKARGDWILSIIRSHDRSRKILTPEQQDVYDDLKMKLDNYSMPYMDPDGMDMMRGRNMR